MAEKLTRKEIDELIAKITAEDDIIGDLYCLKCSEQLQEEIEQCSCGSREFVTGNLKVQEKEGQKSIVCKCGNAALEMCGHANKTEKHVMYFECPKCGEEINRITYVDGIFGL